MKKFLFTVSIFIMGNLSAQLQNSKIADDCFKKSDYKCAEAEYTKLLNNEQIDKMKSIYYNALGTSQRRFGKSDVAMKSYELAYKTNPSNVLTYINLSSIHSQKNNKQKALDYVAKGLQLDEENVELYLIRAKVYEDLKKNDLAEKDYQLVISKNPDHLIARTNYANFKKNTGRLDDALKDFNGLIGQKPESLLYNNRADTYFLQKKYKEATLDVDKAIKMDPKYSLSYITRAKLLFVANKDKEACEALAKSVSLGFDKTLMKDLFSKCNTTK